jgi:TRAP-type transport system small permease protein
MGDLPLHEASFWNKLAGLATRALTFLCATILFLMMMLTITDVFMRYVLHSPLHGAYELTELSLALLIYAGLPLVSLRNLHVTTDFFDKWLTPGMRRVLTAVINGFCSAALLGVSWVVLLKAQAIERAGDTTQVRGIVLAPFVYLIAALILVTAVIHLVKVFRAGHETGSASVI